MNSSENDAAGRSDFPSANGRKKNAKNLILLQLVVMMFALSGVFVKLASASWKENGLFCWQTLFFVGCYVLLLMGYAFLWQNIIIRVPLSTAYLNKSFSIVWSLVFAVVIFREQITLMNLLGAAVLICGIIMVTLYE